MIRRPHLVSVVFVALCGCGDDVSQGSPGSVPDAAEAPADADMPDSCVPSECRVWPDYGSMGAVEGIAFEIEPATRLSWHTNIDGDCALDTTEVLLMLELLDGRGTFDKRLVPGTYVLQADDAHRDTCGACLKMVADSTPDDAEGARCYFASSGTLTLVEIDEWLAGSMDDVTFAPIVCATGEPLDSPCLSHIGSFQFDSPYFFTD